MEHSPLATLPPELRNRIYELVIINAKPIRVSSTHHHGRTKTWKPPGLLRTCRQIAAEATAAYYSRNTFTSQDTSDLGCEDSLFLWFLSLPEAKQAMVRWTRLEVAGGSIDRPKATRKHIRCRTLLRDADVAISPHMRVSVRHV